MKCPRCKKTVKDEGYEYCNQCIAELDAENEKIEKKALEKLKVFFKESELDEAIKSMKAWVNKDPEGRSIKFEATADIPTLPDESMSDTYRYEKLKGRPEKEGFD